MFSQPRPLEEYQKKFLSKREILLDEFIRDKKEGKSVFTLMNIAKRTKPLEPLKYKLKDLPENHSAIIPLGDVQNLPFFVLRTKSHNLPVYE